MFLAHLFHLALVCSTQSGAANAAAAPPRAIVFEVAHVPPRYGGTPVYLRDVAVTRSAPFLIATDEDPAILAPPESKARRFGFASESEVAARARELVRQYALTEGESDSPALHRVLARHAGASRSPDVASADSR